MSSFLRIPLKTAAKLRRTFHSAKIKKEKTKKEVNFVPVQWELRPLTASFVKRTEIAAFFLISNG